MSTTHSIRNTRPNSVTDAQRSGLTQLAEASRAFGDLMLAFAEAEAAYPAEAKSLFNRPHLAELEDDLEWISDALQTAAIEYDASCRAQEDLYR